MFSIKALVGISGSNINYMIEISGARIRILPEKLENPLAKRQFCQRVIVSGTCKAQWKVKFKSFFFL